MSEDKDKVRAAILQRRARLMALTLATVSTGSACGGKAEGERQNTNGDTTQIPEVCLTMICLQPPDEPCLSYPCLSTGGGSQVCLSFPATGGTGGAEVCLTAPYTGGMGGLGGGEGLGGEGGVVEDDAE